MQNYNTIMHFNLEATVEKTVHFQFGSYCWESSMTREFFETSNIKCHMEQNTATKYMYNHWEKIIGKNKEIWQTKSLMQSNLEQWPIKCVHNFAILYNIGNSKSAQMHNRLHILGWFQIPTTQHNIIYHFGTTEI